MPRRPKSTYNLEEGIRCECGAPAVDRVKRKLVCADCMNPEYTEEYTEEYIREQRRYWMQGGRRSSPLSEAPLYGSPPPRLTVVERRRLGV